MRAASIRVHDELMKSMSITQMAGVIGIIMAVKHNTFVTDVPSKKTSIAPTSGISNTALYNTDIDAM